MADIFYHGKHDPKKGPRIPSRAETLKLDILEEETRRMKSMVIPRERLIQELDRAQARMMAAFEESALEMGTKEELKRIWFATRKKVLRSRADLKTLLKAARAMVAEPEEPNGAH